MIENDLDFAKKRIDLAKKIGDYDPDIDPKIEEEVLKKDIVYQTLKNYFHLVRGANND